MNAFPVFQYHDHSLRFMHCMENYAPKSDVIFLFPTGSTSVLILRFLIIPPDQVHPLPGCQACDQGEVGQALQHQNQDIWIYSC